MTPPEASAPEPFGTYAPSHLQSQLMQLGAGLRHRRIGAKLLRSALKAISPRPIDKVVLGQRMRLHTEGNACERRLLVTPQLFDPEELAFLDEVVRPGFVFLDIGANVGAYAIFVARRASPGGRVIAVEPGPAVGARLACNLALNGLDWVEVAPVALADRAGELEFVVEGHNMGRSSLKETAAGRKGKVVVVPAMTLLALLAAKGVTHVDAMKIDVERAEDMILIPFLKEAPDSLLPRHIIMERDQGAGATELPRLLAARGYKVLPRFPKNQLLERV